MDSYIQIKCPFCGALLKVKQQPGLDKASITCPVCKRKSAFNDYRKVAAHESEDTDYLNGGGHGGEHTEINEGGNGWIGCLVEKSVKRWSLHVGVNTVGRKTVSTPPQADIPITDCTGQRLMSRKHARIEVVRLPGGGYKHVLSNWLNKNPTTVDGGTMEADDRIVLHDGMAIRFADIEVKFIISDPEGTI